MQYSARQAAEILGVPEKDVRAYARAASLPVDRLEFQDMALLKKLVAIAPARRAKQAVAQLRSTQLSLDFAGDVAGAGVRDGEGATITPIASRRAAAVSESEPVDDVFARAVSVEQDDRQTAKQLYQRVAAADTSHIDARINLGRMFHHEGDLAGAEHWYRAALAIDPEDAMALFNLAVALEDQERFDDALAMYRRTIQKDPDCADAWFNIARLLERRGDHMGAIRCLKTYRQIVRR
jgi:tetratricopeptide (TPR) repeat protein